jgi:hypothetical protein
MSNRIQSFEQLEDRRMMATFTVTSVADSGAGSLRDAIAQANVTDAADTITFAIGSGATTINIGSTLDITKPLTVDATTQPGYAGTPLIRIANAGTASSALYVNAPGSVIRGLSITGMGTASNPNDGTAIAVVKQNIIIEKNYLGLSPTGAASPNQNDGIGIGVDGDGAIIRNNVIGANSGDGVQVYADNVRVIGNKIGTDPTGMVARGNAGHGVHNLGFIGLVVGGDNPSDGNLISSNGQAGVFFANINAKGSVFNNYIGVNASGNAKLANGTWGVHLNATSDVVVGAYTKGNRIGGNAITITGHGSHNDIRYNSIGFGVNSAVDVGDTWGIDVTGSYNDVYDNTIGRVTTGIRLNGSFNNVHQNYVGTLEDRTAIPNTNGILVNGTWNELRTNIVANNSAVGVHIQTGSDNSVMWGGIWGSGQALKIEPGVNGNLPVPMITGIWQNTNTGEWTVESWMNIPLGEFTLSYYVSDFAGNPASGHMQKFLTSVGISGTDAYEVDTRKIPASAMQDGRYITVMLCKRYLSQGMTKYGATGMPSPATQLIGLPSVYTSNFEYETGHAWSFQFSDDVSASLSAGDLSIRDTTTNAVYQASSVTWNAATRTARFVRNTPLPDGKYVASIKTQSVSNGFGANVENFPLNFNVLRGDADRNGSVDFSDLLIVAQNYGQAGKTFSQGNFDYDTGGNVNFNDLLIVAQKYGTSLVSAQIVGADQAVTLKRSSRNIGVLD